jgi:hypothetical protein
MGNKIVSGFVAIVIGYFVWFGILFGVLTLVQLFSFLKIINVSELYDQYWYKIARTVLLIGGFILTIILSLRARKSKNIWYEIFKPTLGKIAVDLVLVCILLVFAFLVTKGGYIFVDPSTGSLSNWKDNLPLALAAVFGACLIGFPFSAALYSLKQSLNKTNKLLYSHRFMLIILVILLNPITQCIGAMHLSNYTFKEDIKTGKLTQCGARISQVNSGGAAEEAGMQGLEVIYKINEVQVQSPNELVSYLDQLNTSTPIQVQTQLKTYTVIPKLDSQSQKYRIGVAVDQGYCATKD